MGSIADEMVFQMGYRFGGGYKRFCEDEDILSFTTDLLNSSGWHVVKCAILPGTPTLTNLLNYING